MTLAPAYWALGASLHAGNPTDPVASPSPTSAFFRLNARDTVNADPKLTRFLRARYRGGYLVATLNAMSAAPLILQTGLPVMAMGGFIGGDPAIKPGGLQALAQSGKLTHFLIPSLPTGTAAGQTNAARSGGPSGRGFGGMFTSQQALLTWIRQNCRPVPTAEWQSKAPMLQPAAGKGPFPAPSGTPGPGPAAGLAPGGNRGRGGFGGFGDFLGQEQLYEYVGK